MEFVGILKQICPVQTYRQRNGQEGQKTTIIVEEVAPQYPNSVAIDVYNEKMTELNAFSVGMLIKVVFNTKAKEWKGRAFTNIILYKIEPLNTHQPQPSQQEPSF